MTDSSDKATRPARPLIELDAEARGIGAWMSVLVFIFGIGAGVLLAFSGYAVLERSANLLVLVFLVGIFVIVVFGALAYALRRPVLRYFFGVANTQLETLSRPLGDAAEGAADRDIQRVTSATRLLIQLVLARMAWTSTRKWIVASLTGLIAAMAALAGTALLFEQNELIESEMRLLVEQNEKIELQNQLLIQDVQLSEAERNAQIAVEITTIAELLGDAMIRADERAQSAAAATGQPVKGGVGAFRPVINPWLDLGKPLVMRITSASRAAKPYRFLDARFRSHDTDDKLRVAMEGRRGDLPAAYEAMKDIWGWQEPPEVDRLIDRPASPERAQLLQVLMSAGIQNFEFLSHFGLDLAFAHAEDMDLVDVTLQGAQLSYATFDRARIVNTDFAGAQLENTRFRKSVIAATQFRGLPYRRLRTPFQADQDGVFVTALNGADFAASRLDTVDISETHASASHYDRATLTNVSFAGSDLSAATFIGAVLAKVDFTGASMKSVDFDEAYVFAATFLSDIAETAEPDTFRADRYRLVPVPFEEALSTPSAFLNLTAGQLEEIAGTVKAWRVERIEAFEAPRDGDPEAEAAEELSPNSK